MSAGRTREAWSRWSERAASAPYLSSDREAELIERAQHGDARGLAELCDSHLRLVLRIARAYRGRSLDADDLVAHGMVGLIEAIRRFEVRHGVRLGSYASWWIRMRIRGYAAGERSLVAVPSTRTCRAAQLRLAKVQRSLTQRLGREPQSSELAEALECSEADLAAVQLHSKRNVSLNAGPEQYACSDEDPEQSFAAAERQRVLETHVASALASLRARDRGIVQAHLLEETESMSELANELGVTRQRVAQIVQRVRAKLKDDLRNVYRELGEPTPRFERERPSLAV